LTKTITSDIMGLLTMNMVHWHFNSQYMVGKQPFFTWFSVYYPSNINSGWMGGPKYLDQNYYFTYYGTPNYEHGTLTL
jgi:hypothetical protein